MAKTFIVSGADFSANALDQVSFDVVPCTGLSVSPATLALEGIGDTGSLTAVPVPSNTTDEISWASSDESVATVLNGVVTCVGVGSATITATCGEQTATCAVTATAYMDGDNLKKVNKTLLAGTPAASGGNGLAQLDTSNYHGVLLSSVGNYHYYEEPTVFPYKMPNGTKKVKITVPSAAITVEVIHWFNANTHSSISGYTDCIQLVGASEGLTPTGTVFEVAVPEYNGQPAIDALAIDLFNSNWSQMTEEVLNGTVVEFLAN